MKKYVLHLLCVLLIVAPWLFVALCALFCCESTKAGCAIALSCCIMCALCWDALYD